MASIESFVVPPTEGEVFDAGPFHIVARITGDQTGGTFELHDLTMGPATIDYHVHQKMDETLAVIEGEVEFKVAGKSFIGKSGSVAFAPRGVHHGFTNHGPAKARLLVFFSPAGGQDAYFRELVRLFKHGAPDPADLKAVQDRFDQSLVTFP